MKINKPNKPEMKRHTETTSSNLFEKLQFWKKHDHPNTDVETFSDKHNKASKKRKQRLAIMISLFLIAGGTLTTVAVSLMSNTNVLGQRNVPSSKLSNSGTDEAAKKILKGKAVKVTSSSNTSSVLTKADAQKQMDSAVKAQQSSDQVQINKLQQQVNSLTQNNQSLTSTNSSLSTQSNSSSSTASSYSKQIADLQSSLSSAQSEASSNQQKSDDLQKKLDTANTQVSKADSTSSSSSSN